MALCGQTQFRDEDALRVHFLISCFADLAPLGILIVKKREKGKTCTLTLTYCPLVCPTTLCIRLSMAAISSDLFIGSTQDGTNFSPSQNILCPLICILQERADRILEIWKQLGQELSSCHVHCVDLCYYRQGIPYYYRVGYSMGAKHIVMHIEIKNIRYCLPKYVFIIICVY